MKIQSILFSTGFALLSSMTNLAHGAPTPLDLRDYAPSVSKKGPLPVSEFLEYNSAQLVVSDPEGAFYNADVNAVVRFPLEGDGPFPVVLYLHGRHVTCSYAGTEFLSTGECDLETPQVLGQPTDVINPVDSLKGYDYMANTLASHGYVVVSISANDVNDKDLVGDAGVNARSQLILHHLDILRAINEDGLYSKLDDPYIMADLRGKIDMEHIGLMGHSRGGQGVTHVLQLNKEGRGNYFELGLPEGGDFAAPHNLTAVFALAPTNFDYITAPDTTFAVLLPYCDGDVSNLQGAFMYDDSRFIEETTPGRKFQILTMGANHNFYNTIWTSDDYSNDDSHCDLGAEINGRDDPLDQRRHGEFLMSSFFRLFLGGEEQFAPFWNGTETMPLDACPVDTLENSPNQRCDERFHLSIQTTADERLVIDDVADDTSKTINDLMGATIGTDLDVFEFCTSTDADGQAQANACEPSLRTWSTAGQLYLDSDNTESALTTELGNLDVTAYDHFTFRAGVPVIADPAAALTKAPNVAVKLTDTDGNSALLKVSEYSDALYLPPGTVENSEGAKTILNMVQLPLAAFEGLDFTRLQSVALVNTGDVKLQLAELQFQAIEGPLALPEKDKGNNNNGNKGSTGTQNTGASDTISPAAESSVDAGGGGGALGALGLLALGMSLFARRRNGAVGVH